MFRELTPLETDTELANDDDDILVDCQSPAEWHFTGMPDFSAIGKDIVLAVVATGLEECANGNGHSTSVDGWRFHDCSQYQMCVIFYKKQHKINA